MRGTASNGIRLWLNVLGCFLVYGDGVGMGLWGWHGTEAPYSGVARLEGARVQEFQKGPIFPTRGSSAPPLPHSDGPACTARLAHPIATSLAPYHMWLNKTCLAVAIT